MLNIYNTLSKTKEEFHPINEGRVGMYVCGITVYDYCHIGHARVMVAFDVIVRHLRTRGYDVNYVRNITDIDDKIFKRAKENGEDYKTLTARFIEAMHEDERALNVLQPDSEPRASDHIAEILSMISILVEKGAAYKAKNGDVYFAVEKFESYGHLTNKKVNELLAGARVKVDVDKRSPVDFALWKAAKPGEASWPSPWGDGRPGWHIE
ncbi:MAG: class I tRNA ligase family protein, partial [Pseudomonadales bacterium]|nr:class I tRNA ligase family protein [Pseudomonadales bacterium]